MPISRPSKSSKYADLYCQSLAKMVLVRQSLVWSFLVALLSALPTFPLAIHERATSYSLTPVPPSQDRFYTTPANFESATPGTILRLRAAPGNLTAVVANSSSAYNILYRTTDSRYKPSWAVTTLFVPSSSCNSNDASINTRVGSALLSYQIPYNSFDVDASPSYSLYAGPPGDIAMALGRGWYVNVPDFEWPLASFSAGVEEGHATLDSVRAVLSSGFGLALDARYAMWGYSGGSIATEWAAELQVQYAPELNFSGAALGGLVPNITSALQSINRTIWAGLTPAALLGLTSQYPAAYEFLVSKLKPSGPYNRTTFLSAKHMSYAEDFVTFANQNVFDYFEGGIAVFESPIIQKIIQSNGFMGYHGVPQMPLFVYKAIQDELTRVNDTDALVAKYCAVGANILYQRNTVGGHLAEYTNGVPRAFEWLSSVLDGTYSIKYSPQGCTIQNVAVNITSTLL